MAEVDSRESDHTATGYQNSTVFLTSIFNRLASLEAKSEDVPTPKLSDLKGEAAETAKSIFLTLHFLFPHEVLPALDLIDRSLVNRHRHQPTGLEVYYIQSASSLTDTASRAKSRYHNAFNPTKTFYEVRLDSWNCSCAAFAQSSLRLLLARSAETENQWLPSTPDRGRISIGGTITNGNSPVAMCKHILATVIAESCPSLFEHGVTNVDMSENEMAAWAGGWGEM